MDDRELAALLPAELDRGWRMPGAVVSPLGGGMNSATALVESSQGVFVAKWVPQIAGPAMRAGFEVVGRLESAGIPCGAAVPTQDGDQVRSVAAGELALMRFVPGRELTSAIQDQPLLATTLARAHAGLGTRLQRADFFDWLGSDPRLAEVGDWIRPAIRTVVQEYRALPPLTWGTLHADPAPEAFRYDEASGVIGMIDWAAACEGPLLYDVASALMYLGGLEGGRLFLQTYRDAGALPASEIDQHLPTLRRFRAIVQADYFAGRILADDRTGIDDPAENRKGLDDAYAMLADLGALGNDDVP